MIPKRIFYANLQSSKWTTKLKRTGYEVTKYKQKYAYNCMK